jgi:hypothetical protein
MRCIMHTAAHKSDSAAPSSHGRVSLHCDVEYETTVLISVTALDTKRVCPVCHGYIGTTRLSFCDPFGNPFFVWKTDFSAAESIRFLCHIQPVLHGASSTSWPSSTRCLTSRCVTRLALAPMKLRAAGSSGLSSSIWHCARYRLFELFPRSRSDDYADRRFTW